MDLQLMTPFTSLSVVITGSWEKSFNRMRVVALTIVSSGATRTGLLWAAVKLSTRTVGLGNCFSWPIASLLSSRSNVNWIVDILELEVGGGSQTVLLELLSD